MIAIEVDQQSVAAGEFMTGHVRWGSDDDRRARQILVGLEWHTDGAGNRACGVSRAMRFVPKPSDRAAAFPFRLMVPHEGPVSFEGELITVGWNVKVRVDQMGLDEFAEKPFSVALRRLQQVRPS
jgi:hypothetical protein